MTTTSRTHRRLRGRALAPALLTLLLAVLLAPALVGLAPQAQAGAPSEATWKRDVAAAMKDAPAYLDQIAATRGNLAINLDIDNTSLATSYHAGTAVAPVLRAAKQAHRLGMKVYFNTGRRQSGLAHVRQQLLAVGFPLDGICGRHPGESLRHSKQRCRDAESAGGTRIVANVGNNDTDFVGKHQGKHFVLPNYGGALG